MSTEQRPDGYFWVKEKGSGKWVIAEWEGCYWLSNGYIEYSISSDSFWAEIDPTPIIRKPNEH